MHPGSIYYHFKSKEQLYLACLQYYLDWHFKPRIDQYLTYTCSVSGLRRFFTSGYRHPEGYRFRNSCFLVTASNDLHLLPEEASILVQQGMKELQQGLTNHLSRAIEKKQLLPGINPERATGELINLYMGIQVQARISPNLHALDKHVKHCLNNILHLQNS